MGVRTYLDIYPYEARIDDTSDLIRTYAAVDWLSDHNLQVDRDWKIDMKGGREGHTSFYFKKSKHAMMFKLSLP
jgi:hypothetical protein